MLWVRNLRQKKDMTYIKSLGAPSVPQGDNWHFDSKYEKGRPNGHYKSLPNVVEFLQKYIHRDDHRQVGVLNNRCLLGSSQMDPN